MNSKELLEQVSQLGYPLRTRETPVDVNQTLSGVVQSHNLRLWEGFPVMLVNAHNKKTLDYKKLAQYLQTKKDRHVFASLVSLSLALYSYFHLKYPWMKQLFKNLPERTRRRSVFYFQNLKQKKDLLLSKVPLNSERLKTNFQQYMRTTRSPLKGLVDLRNEFALEYALSNLLSPKQKELFLKKLQGQPFSKVEREYFSRTVKKKVAALANSDLHHLAQQLML
jgi:hypothetical protein